ncbi:MAG: ABC transporter permease [Caldilineaceae bacterium SB0670_bin_27]|uniref:ABC transporter permease n=1 Tax=Caldilineaceae bacterium SB0664_bin_27 TaxID=2605260 RepID=A0A6B0YRR1_9CHLR|nr:ABC transporter permease [Caldilineaceae bacterium]MDE0336822.1 ABC transporter permease [Caldilineaceae bacterium]MXY93794.1 ABC transporter permease [Caldilineaceae bacterium SB0664_bin_27]MYJ77379.1 ABC transporter permease [Caldilineaceae bacterium SB0670_bin_27]
MTAQGWEGEQTDSLLTSAWKGFRTFVRLLSYNRVGFIGFLVVIFMILLSYAGPLIIELDTKTKIDKIYITPTIEHPLGTDHQGRDIWSQIVNGGKDVIYVAFLAAMISTVIAVVFGTLSGFIGGWVDSAIMSVTDIILTIPQFPLLAVLAAFISLNSLTLLGILMGLLNWPTLLRALRAQALSLKQRDFIEAARALDLGVWHIVLREMVPNMMPYIVVSFALGMTFAVYQQAGLVFLGLVPISAGNWSVMIQLAWVRGAIFYKDSVWYIMAPIVAIAILQLAIISMTRSLELVFNPRLRASE